MNTCPVKTHLLLCREGYEQELVEELSRKLPGVAPDGGVVCGCGIVSLGTEARGQSVVLPSSFLIFERQRIESAIPLAEASLKQTAREILSRVLPSITRSERPWTAHFFAPDVEGGGGLMKRAGGLEDVFLRTCKERFSVVYRRYRAPVDARATKDLLVMQVLVSANGVWACVMPVESMPDSMPGGLHRMAWDTRSPSRSFLKIEEALDCMGLEPAAGETVVDLGAAPGGWTYAFLKRGCHVTAVDNGPLKLPDMPEHESRCRHIRDDGITFEPDPGAVPVDWLVSDMLIAAGQNLGMFRKWVLNRWMRRFIFNIKIPQQQAYQVLTPVEAALRALPGIEFRMRQLYHDRREVTVMGQII